MIIVNHKKLFKTNSLIQKQKICQIIKMNLLKSPKFNKKLKDIQIYKFQINKINQTKIFYFKTTKNNK